MCSFRAWFVSVSLISRVSSRRYNLDSFENVVEGPCTPESKKHDEIFISRDDVKNIVHEDC